MSELAQATRLLIRGCDHPLAAAAPIPLRCPTCGGPVYAVRLGVLPSEHGTAVAPRPADGRRA